MFPNRFVWPALLAGLVSAPLHADLVISEYVEGSGNNKALELLNSGDTAVDLAAWEVQVYFNANTTAGTTIDLQGTVPPGSSFVLADNDADPAIQAVTDQTSTSSFWNGNDTVVLLNGGVPVDSIGQIAADVVWGAGDTRTQNRTLRRIEGAVPDDDPNDVYDPAAAFAGFPQDAFDDLGVADGANPPDDPEDPAQPDLTCGASATLISSIQGAAAESPLTGEAVVVEAVVTATFEGFDGFYLQEEADDEDGDPATSEGLFVYAPDTTVAVGDLVRVAGDATEYFDLTELGNVSAPVVCDAGMSIAPTLVSLPWASAGEPERYENMLVRFEEVLTVNDNYDLGRYGNLVLGSERAHIPTNVAQPGADAQAVASANARDRILLDDGSNAENPAVVPYPTPELSASNTVRGGDRVDDLVGVLDYRFGEYRLQPVQAPSFAQTNPRTDVPDLTERGNLVVASFNVLNFFNGDGMGGGFPTSRGADNGEELARQRDKLVAAIRALEADIVGLMEIENDGYGEHSAIAELAAALGAEWAYIDPGSAQLGSDEIAVGFVYRQDRVTATGDAVSLSGPTFEDLNRQPLAQTFRLVSNDEAVTVAVNHLKSKGCGDASGADADQGDGQGCWNATRTAGAQALAGWLAGDPTGTGESDVLIIGDLNAYAKEDPIAALVGAGYTDLVAEFVGDSAYSYVYFGEAGYLDHGLANDSLAPKVTGTTVWHVSADEPRALDYNLEYQSPEQQAAFYAADPYRASDHDPVLIGLDLGRSVDDNPADINGDGRVDGRDVARYVLGRIFDREDPERYDINGDGATNHHDFRALLQAKRDDRRA